MMEGWIDDLDWPAATAGWFVAFWLVNLLASLVEHPSGAVFRNTFVSFVHSCVSSGFFVVLHVRLLLSGHFDLALATTARVCTMGYFLYDTVDLVVRLRRYKSTSDWIMIGHHFGTSTILLLCLYYNMFHQLNVLMLVAEPNSIFLHAHAMFNRTAWQGGLLHRITLRLFFATWYVCRMVVMLTVVPALILYQMLWLQIYDRLQTVLAVLALVAIVFIGYGHGPLKRKMTLAYRRDVLKQTVDEHHRD